MGVGYTRQALANIASGLKIFAADINNELNAVQAAFAGTTGHAHDGSIGNGPKINLTTSITGILPVANGGTGGINTYTNAAPTINADSSLNYAVGSIWLNTASKDVYMCMDATVGAAVWQRVENYNANLASIAGLTMTADSMTYATGAATFAVTPLTSLARTLLSQSTTGTMQSTLALVIGTNVQAWSTTLDAFSAYNTNGFLVQTAPHTFTGRTFTGVTNEISITNPDGIAGAPIFGLPATLTFTGKTISNGAFVGATIDNAAIGNTTASSAKFTTVQAANFVFSPLYYANSNAGTASYVTYQSASSTRWDIGKNTTAEGGSNSGSDLVINRYTDAGAYIDTPWYLTRSTGVNSILNANITAGNVYTTASAAGGANFRLPHGAAPSAPVNGDMWTTTTALFSRINGTTFQMATLTGTETLTNKTLTSPSIASGTLSGTFTGGTFSGAALNGTLGATTPSTISATTITASSTITTTAGSIIASAGSIFSRGQVFEGGAAVILQPQSTGVIYFRPVPNTGTNQAYVDTGGNMVISGNYYNSGVILPIQRMFESGQQTITSGGALTIAHGLGVQPKLYRAYLQCVVADQGYGVGYEMDAPISYYTGVVGSMNGLVIVPDSVNLNIRFGNGGPFQTAHWTSGTTVNLTNSSWRLVARAWA